MFLVPLSSETLSDLENCGCNGGNLNNKIELLQDSQMDVCGDRSNVVLAVEFSKRNLTDLNKIYSILRKF